MPSDLNISWDAAYRHNDRSADYLAPTQSLHNIAVVQAFNACHYCSNGVYDACELQRVLRRVVPIAGALRRTEGES